MSPVSGPGTLYCAECGRPAAPDELARFGALLICPACKNNYAQKLREGVPASVQVPYAGFWIRFVAWLIDSIILMVVGSIVQFAVLGSVMTMPQPNVNARPEEILASMAGALAISFLVSTLINCTYESLFVSSRFSATPGKMALSLKVLRPNGARLTLGRAVGRHFAKMLSMLALGIGYIIAGFDSEKRGLHDMICDTRVIQYRS